MAYKEYKLGDTRYAYDPYTGQGIAFADPTQRAQIFGNTPMGDVDNLPVDPTIFNQTPGKAVTGQKDFSTIAKEAGASGMNFSDLQSLLAEIVTPDESNQIRSGLGIDQLEQNVFQLAPSTEQLYQQAYGSAGLADLKAKIESVTKDYNAKKQELNERLAKVNENPWKTEASRLGSVAREKEFFEGTLANYQAEIAQYQDLYNQGINEVNNLVSRQLTDFANNQAINQAKLNYLLGKAEKQEAALATQKNQMLARYYPEYAQAKTAATPPETLGTSETGYYSWNPETRKFDLAVPPARGGSGSGGGSSSAPKATTTSVRNWILQNKKANPDVPYYDLWGQLADSMKAEGLNPDNYDSIFWEILHPEGSAGYKTYKQSSVGGVNFDSV